MWCKKSPQASNREAVEYSLINFWKQWILKWIIFNHFVVGPLHSPFSGFHPELLLFNPFGIISNSDILKSFEIYQNLDLNLKSNAS